MVASSDLQLGANAKVNSRPVPTVHRFLDNTSGTRNKGGIKLPPSGSPTPLTPSVPSVQPTASKAVDSMKHEDEKTALIIGSTVNGLAALWFLLQTPKQR